MVQPQIDETTPPEPRPALDGAGEPPARRRVGEPPARGPKPAKRLRFLRAYWVTFVVVWSYLSLRLQARFRSAAGIERALEKRHRKNARRILRAVMRLQGLFIKVGQLISILANFLPEEFRGGLEALQDRVPPRGPEEIDKRVREEFEGRGAREIFAEFDEVPMASASIGQVHRARLHTGEVVAVKVQYPDIDEIVHTDLRVLKRIVGIIDYFMPDHGVRQVYREVRKIVLEELDFREEAKNLQRISENFEGRADVAFPKVIEEFSREKILTTTFVEGIKVSDVASLDESGIDRRRLARLIIESYCQQIFIDRVYHADPHPGNLMVKTGPTLVFLDFGAVAEISPKMRTGMVEFLQAGIAGDTDKLIRAMKTMGFVSRQADPVVFSRIVAYFHDRFREEIRIESLNLRDIKIDPQKGLEQLADLRRMDISLRDITDSFHVPKEWIMLERTILILMGLCTELDPDLNPMSVIWPYLERFVLEEDGDWSQVILETAQGTAASLFTLPGEMRQFMREVQMGGVRMRFPDMAPQVRVIYLLGHQLMWTVIGVSTAAFALALRDRGYYDGAKWCLVGTGVSGFFLLLDMLSARAEMKRARRNRNL